MEMLVQIIKNRFSTDLIECEVDIEKMIKNPLNKKKEDCPLWSFITTTEKKRSQENYDKIHALLLDFDSCVSIREFQQKYSKFNYFLYTTSSHIKGVNDKFRVILPLKYPIPYIKLHDKFLKKSLETFFDGVDSSCFSNFHNMPNVPTHNPEDYEYFINSGETFCMSLLENLYKKFERNANIKKQMKNVAKKDYTNSNLSENSRLCYYNAVVENLRKELNQIPTYKTGSRYNSLVSITGKFCAAKYPDGLFIFDLEEIKEWIKTNCRDKAVIKMVENLYQKRS